MLAASTLAVAVATFRLEALEEVLEALKRRRKATIPISEAERPFPWVAVAPHRASMAQLRLETMAHPALAVAVAAVEAQTSALEARPRRPTLAAEVTSALEAKAEAVVVAPRAESRDEEEDVDKKS